MLMEASQKLILLNVVKGGGRRRRSHDLKVRKSRRWSRIQRARTLLAAVSSSIGMKSQSKDTAPSFLW
jgi:hypothetical protein